MTVLSVTTLGAYDALKNFALLFVVSLSLNLCNLNLMRKHKEEK